MDKVVIAFIPENQKFIIANSIRQEETIFFKKTTAKLFVPFPAL